jgi:porin
MCRSRDRAVIAGLLVALSIGLAHANTASADADDAASLTLGVDYLGDGMAAVSGGLERGTRYLHQFDLYAEWQSAATAQGRRRAYFDLQHTNGQALSGNYVGDTQGVDNLEAPEAWRIAEAWVEQLFGADERAGVRFGLIDLNTQFDVQERGGLFLHSSHGIGPDISQAGHNGPSIFPATGLGLTAFVSLDERWTLRGGVFDGVPGDPAHPRRTTIHLSDADGALLIVEAERRLGDSGRIHAGAWNYSSGFARLGDESDSAVHQHNNRGFYALVEGPLLRFRGSRELGGWLRYGVANATLNPLRRYLGGGVTLTAPFGRDDELGLAFARAEFGERARRVDGLEAAETAIELTWNWPLSETLALQPDLQYVINPGGDPTLENALVIGVRVIWAFERGF